VLPKLGHVGIGFENTNGFYSIMNINTSSSFRTPERTGNCWSKRKKRVVGDNRGWVVERVSQKEIREDWCFKKRS